MKKETKTKVSKDLLACDILDALDCLGVDVDDIDESEFFVTNNTLWLIYGDLAFGRDLFDRGDVFACIVDAIDDDTLPRVRTWQCASYRSLLRLVYRVTA